MISVIVPVYNVGKYIGECIESILKQTYKDWELILVVDGATDNSADICNHYKISVLPITAPIYVIIIKIKIQELQ